MKRKTIGVIAIAVLTAGYVVSARADHTAVVTISQLNEIIDQTNFIVERGCSGTLISREHRLMMTAHHCIPSSKIRWIDKEEVVDGEVKKKKVEVRTDVDVEQVFYDGATKVGGSKYKAEIVAYSDSNEGYDLALLKLRPTTVPMTVEVPMIPKGDEALRGQTAYVIGNPAGQEGSVTKGIIVSMNREFDIRTGGKVKMIQTDAEVFFGNSGGVLMNSEGHYLGTVSRGIPGTAVVFAIHYSHVQDMLEATCYGELFDPEAKSYEDCTAEKKAKAEAEDETVKGLLKKILEKSGGSSTSNIVSKDGSDELCYEATENPTTLSEIPHLNKPVPLCATEQSDEGSSIVVPEKPLIERLYEAFFK